MLSYIILGLLQMRQMTGYDIKQAIAISTSNFYDASFGSIYPMLKKLQSEGHIRAREEVEGGKFRIVYAITDSGRTVFERWLEEPINLEPSRQTFLVKLFFYDRLPADRARALIVRFIKEIEDERQKLAALEPQLQGKASFFPLQTLEYGKDYYSFLARWLRDLQDRLECPRHEDIDHKEG